MLPSIAALKFTWSTIIEEPKFGLHGKNWDWLSFYAPTAHSFSKWFILFRTAFSMTGISSAHSFCMRWWLFCTFICMRWCDKGLEFTDFEFNFLSKKDSCQFRISASNPCSELNWSLFCWCHACECWKLKPSRSKLGQQVISFRFGHCPESESA